MILFGYPPSNDLPLAQLGNVVPSEAEHIHQYVLGILAEFGGPAMAQVYIATFSDHGMRWDNSGKNGLYAPIRWSNLS